ncbi:hypothetical protein MA16_Dca028558 [Dendrobium catenatum]|uniref:Uncharacterized protein n=1 Tax=Dendrobium catenatum TaxID=906689 RepID=A0A2I0VHA0_9ASPA|nr:hypothetical protein MA16_Dca028558 [Dendrobium catenatum]
MQQQTTVCHSSVVPTEQQLLRHFIVNEQYDVNIGVALFICAIFWSLPNLSKKHAKEENDCYGAKMEFDWR